MKKKGDFILLKKIIKQFPKILKNTYVSSNKFIDFVKNHKNIYKINSHIIRNRGASEIFKKEQKNKLEWKKLKNYYNFFKKI